MMRIGYYAHHHGSGHCRQIDKLAALLPTQKRQQLTVFTSLVPEAYTFTAIDEQQIVRLYPEDERTDDVLKGRAGKYWQPASLHYSPIGNADIQKRSHQILNTIVQRNIDLMIIDVSVEVAMLCRTASIPYLYVRLPGLRDDTPHIDAFAGALALLAPYPQAIEAAMTPRWVCQKTVYLDFINLTKNNTSSHQNFIKTLTTLTADHPNVSPSFATKPIITVIKGYGGHEAIDAKLPELRRLLPSAFILSLGPIDNDMRAYVDIATHVEDVTPFMHHSDYLLMACGLNAVAQAYYCATPFVVLPDERPHQEQATMAQALIDQGRALSWEQFVHSMSAESTSAYPTKTTSVQTQDTLEDDRSSFSQKAGLSKAQALMDSIITYSTAKSWFNEWLLPQLELRPDA
ncbi:hypothetical protein [Psychrobacter alimentarius]|uniref:hypothetical protein n=1 Tax=Psychrobacter alimentarius TaxID=261164 RepID=UPI001917B23E|nr:hypothetical protein [Psychrobacter alimentarius]